MPRITGTPHGYMTPDGSMIQMTLSDDAGSEHVLEFSRPKFESFLKQSIALLGQPKTSVVDGATHQILHVIETFGFRVAPMKGKNKVAITFVGNGTLQYHFALSVSECPQFRDDMLAAEKKCK